MLTKIKLIPIFNRKFLQYKKRLDYQSAFFTFMLSSLEIHSVDVKI